MESERGFYRYSTARMGVVVMMLMAGFALISPIGGQSTNLTSPCDVMSQGLQITISNITLQQNEVCSSGCCTYTCPPTFLDHLKKEQCEATWYTPEMTSLADPKDPQHVSDLVVNVTLHSLITKKHVDGVFICINCLNTSKRYKAVYRVSGSPPGAPPPDQSRQSSIVSVAVGSVAGFAILAAVTALIYCREQIRRQICGSENPGEEGIELRGQGGGEPRVEEEEV